MDTQTSRVTALVLTTDLQGYTAFAAQPDSSEYTLEYIEFVNDCIGTIIRGGSPWWTTTKYYDPMPEPTNNWMGDGNQLIWPEEVFADINMMNLVNRLRDLSINFERINIKYSAKRPGLILPRKIRFGLAQGLIRVIKPDKSRWEYGNCGVIEWEGYACNFSAKLQCYCRSLSFLASARIGGIEKAMLKNNYYKRIVATNLPGMGPEIVFAYEVEYEALEAGVRDGLFGPFEIVTELGKSKATE